MTSPALHFRASLRGLEATVRADLLRLHVRTQAVRFARLTVLAFAAQAAALGIHDWGWQALASVGLGAAETAARQLWPALPIAEIKTLLRLDRPASDQPSAPAAPGPSPTANSAPAARTPATDTSPAPTASADVANPQPPGSGPASTS